MYCSIINYLYYETPLYNHIKSMKNILYTFLLFSFLFAFQSCDEDDTSNPINPNPKDTTEVGDTSKNNTSHLDDKIKTLEFPERREGPLKSTYTYDEEGNLKTLESEIKMGEVTNGTPNIMTILWDEVIFFDGKISSAVANIQPMSSKIEFTATYGETEDVFYFKNDDGFWGDIQVEIKKREGKMIQYKSTRFLDTENIIETSTYSFEGDTVIYENLQPYDFDYKHIINTEVKHPFTTENFLEMALSQSMYEFVYNNMLPSESFRKTSSTNEDWFFNFRYDYVTNVDGLISKILEYGEISSYNGPIITIKYYNYRL
ncbi:MAG: hypothetical protein Kapaf2KO_10470 [Candidatus Kapaibacteriales bacterium]